MFAKLTKLPITITDLKYIPLPSYYYENNIEYIIISTHSNEKQLTPGIYKFNIKHNTTELLYEYPSTFTPKAHGQFLDERNSTLYIIGYNTYNDDGKVIFGAFDLKTNDLNIPKSNLNNSLEWLPNITLVPTNNTIHIYNHDSWESKYLILKLKSRVKRFWKPPSINRTVHL